MCGILNERAEGNFQRYYVGIVTLLAYDYCLTIGQEVEEIWTGNRSLKSILSNGNMRDYSFRSSSIFYNCILTFPNSASCARFAIVKWFQTLLIIIPAETVLLIRTFTLTNHHRPIAVFLGSLMIFQCFVVFYAMSRRGENRALASPFEIGDPYHACILFSEPRMDAAYLGVTILFDFTVFASTIIRTLTFRTKEVLPTTVLLRTILRDGVLYFGVILSGNVVWMICALTGRVREHAFLLPFFILMKFLGWLARGKTYKRTVSLLTSFLSSK
ncbi:hypothetical protein M413DRAFT_70707 [Hebeloma cylindrosporum]|uniref:DUF6533 domain-containing protein n=1 Tax=Hebeloma cylindrosporum TaxID=76867 RepID=A0A0C3CE03_HEBCY|nr:hypothetical protein M413DRAFT_70707 [Hebeloma cylindrosporum h7]